MIASVVVHCKHGTAVTERRRLIFDEAQQCSHILSSSNCIAKFILDALVLLRDEISHTFYTKSAESNDTK